MQSLWRHTVVGTVPVPKGVGGWRGGRMGLCQPTVAVEDVTMRTTRRIYSVRTPRYIGQIAAVRQQQWGGGRPAGGVF